jgi:hypothetical protein
MADDTVPQIHCDHECVCWWYYEHKKSGTASPCESEKCHHRFQFNDELGQCMYWGREKGKACCSLLIPDPALYVELTESIRRDAIFKELRDFDWWFSGRHVGGQSPIIPEVRQELHRRMGLRSPRHGGESPARQGCEGAVSEDSRKED